MKRLTFTLLMLFAYQLMSAQNLPYYTGFDNAQEKQDWKQFRVGQATDPFYKWGTNNSVLAHGYPVGGTQVTDDWMVSPEFSFPTGGKVDSVMFKSSGFGVVNAGDTIGMYLLTGNNDPKQASSITLLKLFTDQNFQNDNTWRTFSSFTISPQTEKAYIGFRYHTINNWFDVAIDSLYISGNPTSIQESLTSDDKLVNVYPQPMTNELHIESQYQEKLERVSLFDLRGKLVQTEKAVQNLNISALQSGSYILVIELESKTVSKQVIKQ